jgi:hypothetical protein
MNRATPQQRFTLIHSGKAGAPNDSTDSIIQAGAGPDR